MKTKIIKMNAEDAIDQAISVLKRGGLIVFPTDTVYGLAAAVMNEDAIDRIYEAKGREQTKAIAVLLGDLTQLEMVGEFISEEAKQIMDQFWPGALTAVIQKRAGLPENLSLYPTVGVRIPNHVFVRELLCQFGPLATTSANISGQIPATNAEMAFDQLNGSVDLIIDGGDCAGGVASTVVDFTIMPPKILREGAISKKELMI